MNRIEIKEKAKEIVRENLKKFWKGYFIIIAIFFLCNCAVEILFKDGSLIYNAFILLISFFSSTLTVGFYYYVLKMVRNEEPEKEDLFCFVGNILPIAAISILTMIFTLLWSILFIIPGIIAAISYSMVFYIYVDNPEYTPMDYLSKSKEMMMGYKWNYFVFQISFIGWILLCLITFGIALIWVVPYVTIAQTLYYDKLKLIKEKENREKI